MGVYGDYLGFMVQGELPLGELSGYGIPGFI